MLDPHYALLLKLCVTVLLNSVHFRTDLYHSSRAQSLLLFKYITHLALDFDLRFLTIGHGTTFLSLLVVRQLCKCITTD